jgi:hypothetical protein
MLQRGGWLQQKKREEQFLSAAAVEENRNETVFSAAVCLIVAFPDFKCIFFKIFIWFYMFFFS